MNAETREVITWALGTVLVLCTLTGLAVRFVLMPYLRDHLVKPMKQVEKQVTENHHSNPKPTVLDRIDDVQTEVKGLGEQMQVLVRAFDGHMDWSEKWVALVEREVALLRRECVSGNPPGPEVTGG